MKRLLTAGIFCIAATVVAADTSKLVDASKEAKPKRKASKSKVITNEDVKNSKGKIIELQEKPLPPVEKKKTDGPTTLQQQDERHRTRLEAEGRVDGAARKVAELEKELEQIEQSYFEEDDPDVRDAVIPKKFTETKRALDQARAALFEAAGELDRITKP
jgi:hypothetical protein